ncbi:UV-damaged DNA-binding 1 [Hyphodiscus hymeniophilus]|uniref:UV-damaged DNA-binding 1 n=1 Tax=Hyphodiscus hymeniophilus TaxID=353542 RepID=A0A9P7B0Y3_9HELO|nr:UV-damaged DNA-binding 1 [Hyphodiscus hymeniophilus]
MAYLAPIHRPSSIRHAIKCRLTDPEEECLVLAKANRVEVWRLSEGVLVTEASIAIYGHVSMLAKIRPVGATIDHLFIGTTRFQYFTVVWNSQTRRLDTVQSFVDAAEKHMRDSQSRDRCLVDPTGRYFVMELFEGVINLVRVIKPRKASPEYLEKPEQVRITELRVRASAFLYTETNRPKLALLHDNGMGNVQLSTYRIVDEKSQYSDFDPHKNRENDINDLDQGASHLIPVPKGKKEQKRYIVRNAAAAKAQLGGVIVVGETKMTYLDDESKAIVEYALDEASIFVAWERFDDLHYLLADDYGYLHLLTILVDGAVVTNMEVRKFGKTSKATVLVNMGEGILFIASHEADSQVVRLELNGATPKLEILQTIPNVAPILDFEVMDMGGREGETRTNEFSSGQARLVTGSGVFEGGSLRSVRSGVGLQDLGTLAEMENIRGVFALRSGKSLFNDILVISRPIETMIVKIESESDIEELCEFRSFSLDQRTLLATNISNDLILQVTETTVTLLSQEGIAAQWTPPAGQIITAASANESYILLSANGVNLVSLNIRQGLKEITVQSLGNKDQIACVHVSSQAPNVGVVGFWKSGSISILDLETLTVLHSENLRRTNDASIPRNLALTQVLPTALAGPTLFVAMEDGIVLTFNVDRSNYSLSGRKSIVLGVQEAQLQILPRKDGLFNVFATCEHPSLIYGSEGRIVYSAVTADSATHVCSFNSEAFPDSIVVSTAGNIKISQIDTERRTHITTLQMGETVRRIAYSATERAFGIGCIKRELSNGEEIITSTFRLVEDINFGKMGKPFVLRDENGPELIECVIRAELPTVYSDHEPAERFIVGTSYLDDEAAKESDIRGRLLVFGVDSDKRPYLVTSLVLKGACRRVAILDGMILAALTKTVVMYKYVETMETHATLTKVATYRTSTCPIDLDVTGNIIAVSDLMKSVSLVEYQPGRGGDPDKLVEVARHHQSCWSTAVTHIEGNSYLESDAEGNLIVLKRNVEGVLFEDKKRMEVTSEMNLGEQVNTIRQINVEVSPNAMIVPKAFLATTEGSIYLFSIIAAGSQNILMELQNRMSSIIQTLGNMDFYTYRSFKNGERESAEPFRFVDGELIERFLDVDEATQGEICKGLGPSVEDMRNMVEELKRLH